MRQQPFASPGEALEHYGVKGMRWGVRKEREISGRDLAGHAQVLGGLGHGHPKFELKNPNELVADRSKGYTDIQPKNGFANQVVADRHAEMIATLDQMRERYPAVANLKIEVVPMTHVPDFEGMEHQSFASVMAIKPGEARVIYNDFKGELAPYEADYVKSAMPGYGNKNYLGNHEMGHLLAVANGTQAPAFNAITRESRRVERKYIKNKHKLHKAALKRHGLSFEELSRLSPYAATEPSEALAELSGFYHTPSLRATLSPDTQRKAESLFNELGGRR